MVLRLAIQRPNWPYKAPFRISYQSKDYDDAVIVELRDGDLVGRGEAIGVSYHGETGESMSAEIGSIAASIEQGLSRDRLRELLPPGGARNAVDCALWDLEAKRQGHPAWVLAGLQPLRPLYTDFTLSIGDVAEMAAAAQASSNTRLKVKLSGAGDLERVRAVRTARPDAQIIVDANQAWTIDHLRELVPALAELRVLLIEQPLKVGEDDVLQDFTSPIPICADESCQTVESLSGLVGRYSHVNIKLDKTGGLTEALSLANRAEAMGFKIMVGCMGGSSLSMAPAFLIGQRCEFVDLDGPLLLADDVPHAILYDGDLMHPPKPELWG
jgi:L-alanine-DL-glutamate epimerase-like enolase superfamily enzyme